MVKRLILKGAKLDIENNKEYTPKKLAKFKNIRNIVDLFENEEFAMKFNFLKLNTLHGRISKKRQSNVNLFIFMHILCLIFGYFFECPGKKIKNILYFLSFFTFYIKNSIKIKIVYNNKSFNILYLIIFSLVIINFIILIFLDPGFIINNSDTIKSLLDIVENEKSVNMYCPYCIVIKKNKII